jgi:hypothetical protein
VKKNLFVELTDTIRLLARKKTVPYAAGFMRSAVEIALQRPVVVRTTPLYVRHENLLSTPSRNYEDVDFAMAINNDLAVLLGVVGYLRAAEREAVLSDLIRDMGEQTIHVNNLQSGLPVQIRLCDLGGPCDPSTERYWSM